MEIVDVSPGIGRELMHPNRTANMTGIEFSPDGKRLIAGDYAGGTIIVWDVETARQLTEIQSLPGGSGRFHVTADWKTVYGAEENHQETKKSESKFVNGERVLIREYASYIRAWDLNTGDVLRDYQHDPPRLIRRMSLYPDASKMISQSEELSGDVFNIDNHGHATLWNLATSALSRLKVGIAGSDRIVVCGADRNADPKFKS